MPLTRSLIVWPARRTLAAAAGCVAIALAGTVDPAAAQDETAGPAVKRARGFSAAAAEKTKRLDTGDAVDDQADPGLRPSLRGDDLTGDLKDGDDPEQMPRDGVRPVLKDGDLSDPETIPQRDGVADNREPAVPQDGADPATVDMRRPEEAALFENPDSKPDPLLFQIEDTEPILDRRPARLFRFEPYDPVGIKAGSFILFPELEFAGNAYSNVFRSPQARSDVTFDVRPSARFVSNWTRHAFEFRATGLASFYNQFDTENDKAYTLEARGRLDITKRLNLEALISHDVAQESRSVPSERTAGTRADVTTDKVQVALNQKFNRLTVQLRGSVTEYAFGDNTTNEITTSNTYRDYTAYEQAVRASWEFKPALSVFTEVVTNQHDYRLTDFAGIDRSSTGERYRAGLSFGISGEILRGEVSGGWGIQRPSNATLPDASGFILDANATWRVTPLTSFMFSARSDFVESTTTGVGSVKTQSLGLDARHAFQRYLIGTAGIAYTNSDYIGSTITEQDLRETLGLEYYLNRETVMFGRYTHVDFTSAFAGSSYNSDEIRVGVRLRR